MPIAWFYQCRGMRLANRSSFQLQIAALQQRLKVDRFKPQHRQSSCNSLCPRFSLPRNDDGLTLAA